MTPERLAEIRRRWGPKPDPNPNDLSGTYRDLAEVHELIEALEDSIGRGRPCPQCGKHYYERACGPTHALISHERWPWLSARLNAGPSGQGGRQWRAYPSGDTCPA